MDRFATYDFLLTFHSNHGPISLFSYHFRDIRRFLSKIAKFSHPLLFCIPNWWASPWNWVPPLGVKKLEWWGYRTDKEVWRYLQPSG